MEDVEEEEEEEGDFSSSLLSHPNEDDLSLLFFCKKSKIKEVLKGSGSMEVYSQLARCGGRMREEMMKLLKEEQERTGGSARGRGRFLVLLPPLIQGCKSMCLQDYESLSSLREGWGEVLLEGLLDVSSPFDLRWSCCQLVLQVLRNRSEQVVIRLSHKVYSPLLPFHLLSSPLLPSPLLPYPSPLFSPLLQSSSCLPLLLLSSLSPLSDQSRRSWQQKSTSLSLARSR